MTAEDVLSVARKELGYCEKKTNSDLESFASNAGSGNYTKYALVLYNAGYYNGNKNGFAWCDVFVDWCFYVAAWYDSELAQKVECQTGNLGAGTIYSANYYKAQGRFDKNPHVGDQIFFSSGGEICHTGLVEDVGEYTITTIEGNSGDAVRRCYYSINNITIAGYGHPHYDGESISVASPCDNSPALKYNGLPTVRVGDVGDAVEILQRLLLYAGERLPLYGADGEFGNETALAVKGFQSKMSIAVDGVCGKNTWKLLVEGR